MTNSRYHDRNRGFIGGTEQAILAASTIGVAGLGGDGGRLAVTLARLGVGHFHLADPEDFEVENLNRQEGSTHATLGQNKAAVVGDIITSINPEATVTVFTDGLTTDNVRAFVDGTDLIADEMEYARHWLAIMLARECRQLQVPVVMGLNVGFGCMVTSFGPRTTTIEEVLGFEPSQPLEHIRAQAVPLRRWVPRIPAYVDRSMLMQVQRGEIAAPSVAPGVDLASGYAATEVFNHLTGRRRPVYAPRVLWFDALERKSRVIRWPYASFYASIGRMVIRERLRPASGP